MLQKSLKVLFRYFLILPNRNETKLPKYRNLPKQFCFGRPLDDQPIRAQKQFLLIYKYVPLNLESLSVQQKQVAIMKGERKDKSKAHTSYNLKSVVLACACQILLQNFFSVLKIYCRHMLLLKARCVCNWNFRVLFKKQRGQHSQNFY